MKCTDQNLICFYPVKDGNSPQGMIFLKEMMDFVIKSDAANIFSLIVWEACLSVSFSRSGSESRVFIMGSNSD